MKTVRDITLDPTNGAFVVTFDSGAPMGYNLGKILRAQDVPELDGVNVEETANVNVIGGIPVLYRVEVADASGSTDVVVTHKIRVLNFWIRSSGAAAHATTDTVQLLNTADAITDALKKTATQYSVIRCATIDPAHEEIAAGGKIRITAAKTTNVACTAYVLAVRVA